MANEDPRRGGGEGDEGGDDGGRRPPSEWNTEQIPAIPGEYEDVLEFDDVEYAALTESGVGFDPVELRITQAASELVRRYLAPTEKFRGEWRRHWIHLAKKLSLGVFATFVLGYLSGYLARQNLTSGLTILVAIWFLVMAWVLWDVAEWYYDRFVLTNRRLMLIGGLVTRNVAMMPLARVTDMRYTQSPLGRVLKYGTFVLESAGQEQALRIVKNLPDPDDLYLQVVEEMYEQDASEARRRPAPVDDA